MECTIAISYIMTTSYFTNSYSIGYESMVDQIGMDEKVLGCTMMALTQTKTPKHPKTKKNKLSETFALLSLKPKNTKTNKPNFLRLL